MIPPRKPKPMDSTSVAELRTAIRHKVQHSREHRFLYRLLCVLLLAEGHGPQQVAEWLGEHARTLERWRKRFLDKGVEGLLDETSPGRPPKLEREQFEALAADIEQPPYVFGFSAEVWQGKLLCEHLTQRYGVNISLRQCQRLLKQLRSEQTHTTAEPEAKPAPRMIGQPEDEIEPA